MTLPRGAYAAIVALLLATSGQAQNAPADDNLNMRFANGIAAIAEDKIITVDDVRREVTPLIPQLQRDASAFSQDATQNEQEFNRKLEALQDNAIQNLIDRVLIIKDFQKDDKKHVPESFVDNQIADELTDQFDNDRSKFLAYLRARGTTMREYRREVEEDIIYNYMMHQQHKSQSIVSPIRIEQYYKENKDRFYQDDSVHLRLIQLSRAQGENDGELKGQADAILLRLRSGEKFEDLAKEYSSDSRRAKGGDWGWMKRSDLKPEFSEPLFAVKKGECSDPVLLPEGCFLLYAEDRKYAGIQPLDEVRDQIERILVQEMGREYEDRWLERLRRNGYVKHF
ncbi:MAG TPA: peptidylprolyl isomerase [Opitutaceae bacterium]|jgi:peptidyl-prolyl cis-trans isomerase SurA|nr:peptidylprolyl isomerase [Opitutaceae bacterium]